MTVPILTFLMVFLLIKQLKKTSEQVDLSKDELALTRKELSRTAKAQEKIQKDKERERIRIEKKEKRIQLNQPKFEAFAEIISGKPDLGKDRDTTYMRHVSIFLRNTGEFCEEVSYCFDNRYVYNILETEIKKNSDFKIETQLRFMILNKKGRNKNLFGNLIFRYIDLDSKNQKLIYSYRVNEDDNGEFSIDIEFKEYLLNFD